MTFDDLLGNAIEEHEGFPGHPGSTHPRDESGYRTAPPELRVFVGPDQPSAVIDAAERAGALVVPAHDARIVIWTAGAVDELRSVLHPQVSWVQLPAAGVEAWLASGLIDATRLWTSASGAYAGPVAEHAVALILAAAKSLPQAARRNEWEEYSVGLVAGATVGVVGGGSIGIEIFRLLEVFNLRRIGLTRSGRKIPGADLSFPPAGLDRLLEESTYVVLAAPLTAETAGMIGERQLEQIGSDGWLINVARGGLVDTEALVSALDAGGIGGACLDVTEPEPLPAGHPLWQFDNVVITPHVANPWITRHDLYARRVAENLDRFRDGRDLLGVVDLRRGY
jgi:phosphoglycerate dehydrogenase-like enzyme